jgi:hypothetical protein
LLFRPESAALVAALQRLALAGLMHPRLSSRSSIMDVLDDDVVQFVVAKLAHLPSRPGLTHPTVEGPCPKKYWAVPPVVVKDNWINIRRLVRALIVHLLLCFRVTWLTVFSLCSIIELEQTTILNASISTKIKMAGAD